MTHPIPVDPDDIASILRSVGLDHDLFDPHVIASDMASRREADSSLDSLVTSESDEPSTGPEPDRFDPGAIWDTAADTETHR